jgi:O-methyltransferase
MFYWMNPAQEREFNSAMETINRIYPRVFAADMMIAIHRNMGFLEDTAFLNAVNAEARNDLERCLIWRLHVLCWCASNALKIDGDFVECGVHQGYCTSVVARYLDFAKQSRSWYLYDTFSGIPQDQLDPGHANPEIYQDPASYDLVRQRLAAYPNIRVVRGRVPEILDETAPRSIAFMHLDLNSAAAELGALERLFDRIAFGGQLVLDDYGWFNYRGQKAAEDPFFRERGCSVLELPTGQGLVIKLGPRASR